VTFEGYWDEMLSIRRADEFNPKAVNNQRECDGSCRRLGEYVRSVLGGLQATVSITELDSCK
jgi:hypothetical protein